MLKINKIEKPTCQKCGSTEVYMRITTSERVCRKCGNIEKIENINDRGAE